MARPKGPLAALDEDPSENECEHPSSCPKQPVVRVPKSNAIAGDGLTLCPFHLAIWIDERAEDVDAEIETLAEQDALLKLKDLPSWIGHGGNQWSRLGIDHHGEGHYYHECGDDGADTARVLLVDSSLARIDVKTVPSHLSLRDWIQHVRHKRGWMRLDPDARRAHEGGESA